MKDKIEEILDNNGIIILDTNVYLNIYERSPEFSNFSVEVLEKIKDKIFMPSTVKREYDRHHNECFNRQYKRVKHACDKLESQLKSSKNKISNQCKIIRRFKFPDIDDVEVQICDKIDEAINIISEYTDNHEILELVNEKTLSEDKVNSLIEWLIENNHVFDDLSIDDLYKLSKEGDNRYKNETPPGYKDANKNEGITKYGDFFIWEEVLRYAHKNNIPIIFVTDDEKNDWFEGQDETKKFHTKLEEEFILRVGTKFLGLTSLEFYDYISDIYGIEKTSAIVYALNYTTKQYIDNLDYKQIIYDYLDKLMYNPESYIDMTTFSASATEGIEISDDIFAEYLNYEIYEITDDSAIYDIIYNVTAIATSYEYWGRDDDTKEVITSPGRTHHLKGKLTLRVEREIDPWSISENDSSYIDAELIDGLLSEIKAYDYDELCCECGKNVGTYYNYEGEPVCEECMVINENGEICTACGRKIPREKMYDDKHCMECANKYD